MDARPRKDTRCASAQSGVYRFDFGATTTEAGYVAVDNTVTYSAAKGYGWLSTTGLLLRDRGAPDDLRRDFIFTTTSTQTFRVTGLTPGKYLMKVLCGDLSYGDHVITVSVPGAGMKFCPPSSALMRNSMEWPRTSGSS